MKQMPKFFGIYAKPGKILSFVLALIPFIVLITVYVSIAHNRHIENPSDKLVPTIKEMYESTSIALHKFNKRTEEFENQLWIDTKISMQRIAMGMGLAALVGLFIGLHLGIYPGLRALFEALIKVLSYIPPIAIMPIILRIFGTDEIGKVLIIFSGTFLCITQDIWIATERLSIEQKVKTTTLGGSSWDFFFRIALPQTIPRLLETVRINLGNAWVYLITSESLASQAGLGYRIFLSKRYFDMSTIIPYVIWIMIITYGIQFIVKELNGVLYPWYSQEQRSYLEKISDYFRKKFAQKHYQSAAKI